MLISFGHRVLNHILNLANLNKTQPEININFNCDMDKVYYSNQMEVCSLYPMTAWQPMARVCDRISVRISFHQASRVSGSSTTTSNRKWIMEFITDIW